MLIGTRKGHIIQSSHKHTSKTDPGALPQRRVLGDSLTDTPGRARHGARRIAGGPVRISGRVPDGGEIRQGLRHGGIVCAAVLPGKRQGAQSGPVAAHASGSFIARTADGTVLGISLRHCSIVQIGDGYRHHFDTSRQKETEKMHGTKNLAFLPHLKEGVYCGADR